MKTTESSFSLSHPLYSKYEAEALTISRSVDTHHASFCAHPQKDEVGAYPCGNCESCDPLSTMEEKDYLFETLWHNWSYIAERYDRLVAVWKKATTTPKGRPKGTPKGAT